MPVDSDDTDASCLLEACQLGWILLCYTEERKEYEEKIMAEISFLGEQSI